MRDDVFNLALKEIKREFKYESVDTLFVKTQKRHITRGRQAFCYICHKCLIEPIYIYEFFKRKGFDMPPNLFGYNVNACRKMCAKDKFFKSVVDKITEPCIQLTKYGVRQ